MAPWTALLDPFHHDPAFRAAQAMHLHNHRCAIDTPGQISDLPLPHIVHLVQAPTTSAALKPPVNRLAPHPEFQCLGFFVQFVAIYPVPRPRQNRRPFFVRQLPSVTKNATSLNRRYLNAFPNSCGKPFSVLRDKYSERWKSGKPAFGFPLFHPPSPPELWAPAFPQLTPLPGFVAAVSLHSPAAWLSASWFFLACSAR
jgi:hypothetical protein